MRCVNATDMLPLSTAAPCAGASVSSDVDVPEGASEQGERLIPSIIVDSCPSETEETCHSSVDSVMDAQVVLPDRYQHMLATRRHQPSAASPTVSGDLTAREKDLGTALAWIRQEMMQMKEQDKCLLKQFIDLRASILHLRCLYHYHSSTSDISSLQGSSMSLNETRKSPRTLHVIPRADSDLTVATDIIKATSLPNSPQLFRFKWRSNELM